MFPNFFGKNLKFPKIFIFYLKILKYFDEKWSLQHYKTKKNKQLINTIFVIFLKYKFPHQSDNQKIKINTNIINKNIASHIAVTVYFSAVTVEYTVSERLRKYKKHEDMKMVVQKNKIM